MMSVHLKPSQTVNTNLYCCNLPLAADKSDLLALFSPYGQLTHCTILATLDASGRRRAFLDFATPAQAAEAKRQTHTRMWNGYALEVTYATVQRSTGPLSIYEAPPGGWDRPPPRTNSEATFEYIPAPGQGVGSSQSSPALGSGGGSAWGSPVELSGEGSTVVVTGLDLAAIGSPNALLSLFKRFGSIRHAYVDAPNQVGVLSFVRKAEAEIAVEKMDGTQIGRNVIGVLVWEEWEEAERDQHSDQSSATSWNEKSTVAPTFGTTSTFTSPSPGWNPAINATRPAPAQTSPHARNPLGTIQLNPAAREFTARR